jgi:arylsulfatase A-like enzyme|tara:strand:+ start:140 stop:1123 length:984 start_codon:yes stop_codon:yes gene_type:complete
MAARVACPLEEYPELGRTDAAIDFLERQVASEGSFFLQLNYFGPHYPHYLPEPYHSMYDPLDIPACPNFKARSTTPHYGDRWLRQRWSPDTDEWAPYAEIVAAQYGQVTLLEHEIQRVLDALDRLQLADGTLVIFASDHGELAGAHGLMQKGAVAYDELYRVPLIARWPGVIDPGSSCDSMVNLFDLMPTILEAACCQPPDDIDARSLLPLLEGQSPADWPEQVFCEYLATQAGDMALKILRTRTHKLAVNLSDGDELYDLEDDPGETKNRIGQPSCAPVLKDLARRLDTEMRRTHDPLAPRFQRRMAPYLRVADGRGTTGNSPSPG